MKITVAATRGTRRVLLADSIAEIGDEDAGHIVVSGSHGGRSAGDYATRCALALCCFNDAGIGKENAGIAALAMLEARGTPAIAYGHMSARIGDARDGWENGIVTHANGPARTLGFAEGQRLRDAILRFGVSFPGSPT